MLIQTLEDREYAANVKKNNELLEKQNELIEQLLSVIQSKNLHTIA